MGFPCGSAGKESAYSVQDLDSIPGLERSPGEGKGYPLQYSGLENSMDCSPWGRKESDRGSNFHFTSGLQVRRWGGLAAVAQSGDKLTFCCCLKRMRVAPLNEGVQTVEGHLGSERTRGEEDWTEEKRTELTPPGWARPRAQMPPPARRILHTHQSPPG